ncbi:hypothetical protein Avbf_01749 [Armadillidium vulgare]|nr:hypothetical protein Avbf_01749 [Armadillidium vulgare]
MDHIRLSCDPCSSVTWSYYCAHHDDPHVVHQCRPSQNFLQYAAVGYLGKRIQMRKNRIMNLQKLAEQRKAANAASEHPDHNIKQTLRGKVRHTL